MLATLEVLVPHSWRRLWLTWHVHQWVQLIFPSFTDRIDDRTVPLVASDGACKAMSPPQWPFLIRHILGSSSMQAGTAPSEVELR